MPELVSQFATCLAGFFAIMNPIANTPIFMGLTADDDAATKRAIATRASLLAFVIVTFFCVAGNFLFTLFGITLPAFRITGGILIFLIGFHMLQGDRSQVQSEQADGKDFDRDAALGIAVSPLAMPILAGPGTIAAAMSFVSDRGTQGLLVTVTSFGILCFVTYLFFIFGERLVKFVGNEAIRVITKMMGLILAVIGTQMVMVGIQGAQQITG